MTYLVTPANEAATGVTGLRLSTIANVATNLRNPVSAIPLSIPTDQVYYWSYRWQESERKAREDLESGRFEDFTDPSDAIRHLLK